MQLLDSIFGDKKDVPQIVNNPFNFQNIERIHIHFSKEILSEKWSASASVYFKNGNTKGEQTFKGENLADIYVKVYEFCNQLSNNR